jgi:A/G-specific adenine glycosylase
VAQPTATPVAAVRPALLQWYAAFRRDLPWRRTTDPYAVWVSEIMLQQTRVAVVIPYYERFLTRLPTIAALARADLQTVLHLWAGLGYYSRARNLHAAAVQIVERHGGAFPPEPAQARALPGIGEYTAAAILSIAFGARLPSVDGNVERVLCRVAGLEGDPKRGATRRALRKLAQELVDCDRPGDVNQALMELGATVCLPAAPACGDCPLAAACEARRQGRQADLPRRPARVPLERRTAAAAIVRHEGKVLLAQRPPQGVWAGLWEFPQVEVAHHGPRELAAHLREALGITADVGPRVLTVRHGIMNRQVTLHVYEARVQADEGTLEGYVARRWVEARATDGLALSAPHRRIAEWLTTDREPVD